MGYEYFYLLYTSSVSHVLTHFFLAKNQTLSLSNSAMEFVDPRTLSRHNPTPPSRDTVTYPLRHLLEVCIMMPSYYIIHIILILISVLTYTIYIYMQD